jgi:hypothetical protein
MKTAIIYWTVANDWAVRFSVKGQKKMRTIHIGPTYGEAEDAAMRFAQKGYYVTIKIDGNKFH